MNTYFRTVSILAAIFVAGSALSACGEQTPASVQSPEITQNTEAAETSAAIPEVKPTVMEKDMNGASFTIMTEDWVGYAPLNVVDIYAEETTGEPLNDATFKRLQKVQEQFNCVITWADLSSNDGNLRLTKTVTAGEDAYQLALVRSCQFSKFLTSHLLTDLDLLPHIDLSMPWYDQNSLDALSICNKNYGIVSDLSTNSYLLTFCTYFNQNMAKAYDLGDIYQMVKDGQWTWDKLYSLGKSVSADLNSDGKYTTEDRYGFSYIIDTPEGLLNAAGVRYIQLDENGIPELTYQQQENVDKMQKLLDLLSDQTISINVHQRSKQANVDEVGMFGNGQVLFCLGGIYYADQFRDMKDNFGIIPFPKYEESQTYASPMYSYTFPITVVPATCQNTEDTGILLENMAYEGHKNLLPALYDTILQGKITRDETSNLMLDTIFENTFYDSGILFQFGNITDRMRRIYTNLDGNFISTFEKIDGKVQKDIEKLINAVNES